MECGHVSMLKKVSFKAKKDCLQELCEYGNPVPEICIVHQKKK